MIATVWNTAYLGGHGGFTQLDWLSLRRREVDPCDETNPTSEGVEMSRSGLGEMESGEMYILTGGGTVRSDVQTMNSALNTELCGGWMER